jgi:long-chain acyl-CoA synthetase
MTETEQRRSMSHSDLRVLSDLSIYNCLNFGPYEFIIYEDQKKVAHPGDDEARKYTNIQVAQEAAQLAGGLEALGIQKGDRIIVMMINSPEVLISYQGIARAGGIIIPVLPLLKGPELRYIAENSGARAIITSSVLLPLLRHALVDLPNLQHIISTGTIEDEGQGHDKLPSYMVHAYKDVLAVGADLSPPTADLSASPPGVSPDDTAVILYTSGTTGNPKGVVLTHRNLIANAVGSRGVDDAATRHGEVQLAILPLAHAYGLVATNVAYLAGVTIIMHPRFDTTAVFSAIERYRVNAFAAVPAMLVALLYSPDADKYDTSSLQYCVSGSAPLPVAILEGFEQKFGCRILEGYGLSEASAVLTGHGLGMVQKPGSVGKPVAGVEVLVIDENDQPVPVGEVGEVIARGPNIMAGYYNMPDETQSALRNGWLHTGDMGRFDEDGYLYIVERKKDLIIRGGFNIYPRDVEEVLNTHPSVIESAVVGIPSERMGEEVKAFIVTGANVTDPQKAQALAEDIQQYCRKSLANYKTPSEIEFIDNLPRNAIGKIDKKELRKRYVH